MRKETGQQIFNLLDGTIYEKKQVEDSGVYLTVNKIFALKSGGEMDFGGSEYKEGEKGEMEPVKRTPDDKYGWWNLDPGEYLIEFNESPQEVLIQERLVIMEPAEILTKNGVFHPVKIIDEKGAIRTTFFVGRNGIKIKENARISKLIVVGEKE